jgi:hypothetical protein
MWTVVAKVGNTPKGAALWKCRCSCGRSGVVVGQDLRKGKSTCCGCVGTARIANHNKTHGLSRTRIHRIWKLMRRRCNSPSATGFENYGGRGITICPEWDDFTVFHDWAMSNGYSDALSIERIDVNSGYSPQNCTWATAQTQSENRRFVARRADGKLWWHVALEHGVTQGAYRTRLHDGWPIEKAATTPVRKKRRK